ncbi:MAG TPA: T9SS type A sorting domain-containing protein [Chitinophagaceae bacterium]|jgi:hypothetical protein|nr:T9SS type A sorting domain-containing protein [Chitinophagaceae bacterium]
MKKIVLPVAIVFFTGKAFSQAPFNIGTIHPGDSIVIIYDATINNPLVPAGTTQISNQGTITGSNFSNLVTDDPDSGPVNDPTITLLNMFPLPVMLTELKAKEAGNLVRLNWKVAAEYNMYRYDIEKSTDGYMFTKIGEANARNIPGILVYEFNDSNPFNGNNFYRLRMIDKDGTYKFSAIVKVRLGNTIETVHIFPNPFNGSSVNIQMENMPAGLYTVRLYNSLGVLVMTKQLTHNGGSATELLYLNQEPGKGIYQLEITGQQKRNTFKLVRQ